MEAGYLVTLPAGTLLDSEIRAAAEARELITEGFHSASVRQACYELRASRIFYDLTKPEGKRRTTLKPDQRGFLLGPRRYVVSIVEELLNLPADMLGRIMTKGQLMSLGVLPVNTYADPGFEGRLGITLFNSSNQYIWIEPGSPIAKIEFAKLKSSVDSPYNGQHGYESRIWPFQVELYAGPEELEAEGISPGSQAELALSHGEPIAILSRKVDYYERRVWLQIAILLLAFAILFVLYGELPLLASVAIGLATNVASQLTFWWLERRRGTHA